MTPTDIKEDICHLDFLFVYRYAFYQMYKMNYRTDIVNFLGGGGAYWRGAFIGEGRLLERALISKILLLKGRLLESGRLLGHLR